VREGRTVEVSEGGRQGERRRGGCWGAGAAGGCFAAPQAAPPPVTHLGAHCGLRRGGGGGRGRAWASVWARAGGGWARAAQVALRAAAGARGCNPIPFHDCHRPAGGGRWRAQGGGLTAYWMARWPRPPTPRMATFMSGRVMCLRSGAYTWGGGVGGGVGEVGLGLGVEGGDGGVEGPRSRCQEGRPRRRSRPPSRRCNGLHPPHPVSAASPPARHPP
jgi:hypothetical protein